MLEIKFIDAKNVILSGRFDAAQEKKAMEALQALTQSCVIDFTDLDYISSAGLVVLLSTLKRLDASGHGMVLKNMNSHIRRIFQVSGLDRLFQID